MNEEKYTRNSAKKSTRKKKVNQDIHAGKSHGEKLKNDSSAARSYRDKIRYGKKDNSLSVSEAKELRSMKKQGRRRIYKNQAVAATVRKTTIKNEDDNSGTDSLNAGLAAVETGIGKVREHILPRSITAVTIWMPCREQKDQKKPERRGKAPCQLP